MLAIVYTHKFLRKIFLLIYSCYAKLSTTYLLLANNVKYGKGFRSNGVPIIDVALGSKMEIGNGFKMNNGKHYNRIGRQQKCLFIVGKSAQIKIGNNVGLSSTAIVSHKSIFIGNNVKIGGNTVIYDTDFHSLDYLDRREISKDSKNKVASPIIIENDVFIGAHCTILKGVTIGAESIIGAGSVVTKSIPSHEIWGGNPARFIKKLQFK